MTGFNLSKVVGAGVLSLSLITLPLTLPASAQTDNASPNAMQGTDNVETGEGDRDFDWGWLGLIGLAGLAGLAKKREEPVRYRDPDPANRTGL